MGVAKACQPLGQHKKILGICMEDLRHQGESFLSRFDALSYLYLSRALDYYDPFGEPSAPVMVGHLGGRDALLITRHVRERGDFTLEKAIYELGYELNNRPDWVHLPLAGIRQLLGEDA